MNIIMHTKVLHRDRDPKVRSAQKPVRETQREVLKREFLKTLHDVVLGK